MRRSWTVRMAIALALGLVALATSTARAQETVKVGLPVPLTGFVAESARASDCTKAEIASLRLGAGSHDSSILSTASAIA